MAFFDGENIVISEHGNDIGRVPLHNLESVVAFGSVGATPALMGKCAEDNIGLYFMSRSGKFLCSVCGEINGNVCCGASSSELPMMKKDPLKSQSL